MRTSLALLLASAVPLAPTPDASTHDAERGRELFLRAWVEDDVWAGGNGLGPKFNARSCVDCHLQGGIGGAGPRHRNVTAPVDDGLPPRTAHERRVRDRAVANSALASLIGTGSRHGGMLSNVVGNQLGGLGLRGLGGLGVAATPRNTPALFGAGLIDTIPDEVLEVRAADHGGIVGRTEDGRATRFGWKAEVAHLDDFVNQACAIELGLTTTTHAELPGKDSRSSPKVDLVPAEVDALVAFVAALPKPDEREHAGREIFEEIGCADCHAPQLGEVDGIYSDLLLHDVGHSLAAGSGIYGVSPSHLARFWRTPPLWGVRDSGPWLHDGRASTLSGAILEHGGEAAKSARRFRDLDHDKARSLVRFLEALTAPGLSS